MELTISDDAHKWYVEELDLKKGDSLRIYGKYGGATNVHVGLSTGINVIEPSDPIYEIDKDGVRYYVEATDEWFFGDYKLTVNLENGEPAYIYS
ncbi:HesB/YadR/YfhF family protein [Vagococcus vulneris]|uniref:HesB/YadR/YfhF family protein n=1 Tax=Vagococcus vulneris TaxID=1977869 RepID=A0A429ZZW7_9ENTE|nr:HesB/YadR/YfhF family protein [Vagococcus vulneris]RST99598.1 hypothetical protein CBF37_04550 [Vagococcus vulneris]